MSRPFACKQAWCSYNKWCKERKKKMNRKKFNISLISDVKIKIFQKIIEKRQVMGGGRVNNS